MPMERRSFVKTAAVAGAAALAPQVMVRTARGADKNKVVFVSEESNPKAIAVYDKINADFKKDTGIEVVVETPGFANIAKRVATLIAAGTPPEIVWYGAGQAMNLALENQLADVSDVIKATGGVAENGNVWVRCRLQKRASAGDDKQSAEKKSECPGLRSGKE